MDVVVTGRHCEISESFRGHVTEKLTKLEKHDHHIMRVHVEVDCEPNPRQHDRAVHVELTAFSKGPVIRAEAAADDKMGALDRALDKLEQAGTGRVWTPVPESVDAQIEKALSASPLGADAVDDVLRSILPYGVGNTHPRFLGFSFRLRLQLVILQFAFVARAMQNSMTKG